MIVTRPAGSAGSASRATASCDSGDAVGDLVYVSGNFSSGDYQVRKADVTQYVKMPVIAVIIAKLTSTRAVIQFEGEIKNQYTGLTPGRTYFVGANGRPSSTPPTPGPGQRAYVQPIGVAVDQTVLRLTPIPDMKVRIG
jgi:hypothetical protein